MADVEITLEKHVLWIRLNRPEQLNAMTADMRNEIVARLHAARADTAVRAVVLTGSGKGFCSGADISRPGGGAGAENALPAVFATRETMTTGSQALLRAIWDLEKPVIAAVNGTAAGLGAHLAFASDLVIAAESAKFIEVFVRRGIALDAAGGWLLPRLLPLSKAKELVFFGDDLPAAEAHRLGLVNRLVPADELESAARAWAERLAGGPTLAIGLSKRLLNRGTEVDFATLLAEEGFAQALTSQSEDMREAMAAFREKRKPAFQGR